MEALQLTLTERLRLAALARAERGGRVVDTYVIDEEGVIDLTALEDRGPDSRASDLAPLGDTAGRYGDAADVSSLFEEAAPTRRGRFRRREAVVEQADPEPTLAERLLSAQAAARGTSTEQIQMEDVLPAQAPGQTDDTMPAQAPGQTDDTMPAGDRIESWEAYVPETLPDHEPETSDGLPEIELDSFDGTEIDLREHGRPSNLQNAIDEFNRSNPIEVSEIDIESGIRYGEGGQGPIGSEPLALLDDNAGPTDHVPPSADGMVETETEHADDGVGCPICGRPASLDFENRFLGINFYSCRDCFHMWHLAAEESD